MKRLSEYKRSEDGDYIDDDGNHAEDLMSFLQSSILKFCCCGEPQKNLLMIYYLLTDLKEWHENIILGKDEWDKRQEKLKKYVQDNWSIFLDFFYYVMAEKNITEHGGSIPGWVEDENLYDTLAVWINEQKLISS